MSLDIYATKNELLAIFPQHSEETITRIYNNVVSDVGEDSQVLVLPLCIEQLLELPKLPSNNEVDSIAGNSFGNRSNLFNKSQELHTEHKLNASEHFHIPGLHDSDSSNDGYGNNSSSEEDRSMEREKYRNKARPIYRERQLSRSMSPNSDSLGYLSDRDELFADKEICDLKGFENGNLQNPSTVDKVINISDLPMAGRKRKLNDIFPNDSNLVDLTTEINYNSTENVIKKTHFNRRGYK